jgi:hypothetical protein
VLAPYKQEVAGSSRAPPILTRQNSSCRARERRVLDQRRQLAGRAVVEWEERCAHGACGVANEPACRLDGRGVALAFEELAEWPDAGPELTGGGEVDVVDQ